MSHTHLEGRMHLQDYKRKLGREVGTRSEAEVYGYRVPPLAETAPTGLGQFGWGSKLAYTSHAAKTARAGELPARGNGSHGARPVWLGVQTGFEPAYRSYYRCRGARRIANRV